MRTADFITIITVWTVTVTVTHPALKVKFYWLIDWLKLEVHWLFLSDNLKHKWWNGGSLRTVKENWVPISFWIRLFLWFADRIIIFNHYLISYNFWLLAFLLSYNLQFGGVTLTLCSLVEVRLENHQLRSCGFSVKMWQLLCNLTPHCFVLYQLFHIHLWEYFPFR